jgi:hypothetical protein
MRPVVFAGPTIGARAICDIVGADVTGPVRFGDVYRATMEGCSAIVIIDGYFERVPAVWHKEILWAMSEGVHVFGGSSMGALRAAELDVYGMVGIGAIYEAYRSGAIEDDDEVAVSHAPAEQEFRVLSDALVNIRATLRAATDARIITADTETTLVAIAKRQFYPERSYGRLLEQASATGGVSQADLHALEGWLPSGKVDQKRQDAVALLEHVRSWLESGPGRKKVGFRFEPTDSWHEATQMALTDGLSELGPTPTDSALEEELKLTGVYESAMDRAAARGLTLELAMRTGSRPDAAVVHRACSQFRFRHGLQHREDFERWRASELLADDEFVRFFEVEARLSWARPFKERMARSHLVDHLRETGQYGLWRKKVLDKADALQASGVITPSLSEVGMTESELWQWYFRTFHDRETPADLDGFAVGCGFAEGKEQLRAAVLREAYVSMRHAAQRPK